MTEEKKKENWQVAAEKLTVFRDMLNASKGKAVERFPAELIGKGETAVELINWVLVDPKVRMASLSVVMTIIHSLDQKLLSIHVAQVLTKGNFVNVLIALREEAKKHEN